MFYISIHSSLCFCCRDWFHTLTWCYRGVYIYSCGNFDSHKKFFLSCRNIQIRVCCANIFKSECFVQKYWSDTITRYLVMRGCLFGSDQTKYYVHGCNFHSFSGPFIHKKCVVLYDRRQISYFTMQKNCYFQILSEMSQGCSLHVCLGHFSLIENILKPAVLPDQVYDMWIVKLWKWNGIFVSTIIKSSTIHLCH